MSNKNKSLRSIKDSINRIKKESYITPHFDTPDMSKSRFSTPKIHISPNIWRYIFYLTLLIVLIVLLIVIIFAVYYYKEKCNHKKTFNQYFLDFNLSRSPCKTAIPQVKLEKSKEKEVFHISNQLYTYDQAKCKCRSYGAELATRNEVVKAYNKGANWCSYGWSENQKAYYPTQKCAWDDLQKTDDPEKCGNPGINGGKFPKGIRFGVNCYGYKPVGGTEKPKLPICNSNNSDSNKPFCKKDINIDEVKVREDDVIVDFNNESWSVNELN